MFALEIDCQTLDGKSVALVKPVLDGQRSLYDDRLGKIAGLIDTVSTHYADMICQELKRYDFGDRLQQHGHIRYGNHIRRDLRKRGISFGDYCYNRNSAFDEFTNVGNRFFVA